MARKDTSKLHSTEVRALPKTLILQFKNAASLHASKNNQAEGGPASCMEFLVLQLKKAVESREWGPRGTRVGGPAWFSMVLKTWDSKPDAASLSVFTRSEGSSDAESTRCTSHQASFWNLSSLS